MAQRAYCFSAAFAILVGLCTACNDGSGPAAPAVNGLPALAVSPPEVGAGAASKVGVSAAAVSPAAYVSLPPGTVPDGIAAQIRDGRHGAVVTAQMVNGGFDPIAIAANVGDTIFVEVARTGTSATVSGFQLVVAGRAPHVVRTSPSAGKTDVPLNAIIIAVFSAPIDSTTMDTNSVQLWRGTTPVPGTVRFADTAHVRVEFHPDTLLVRLGNYHLSLSQSIRDVDGVALDSAVTVPFTTGDETPPGNLVFSSVTVGLLYACGITTTGDAYCWGYGGGGGLGTGNEEDASVTPVPVAGGLKFASLSASFGFTCGLTTIGAAYCWGAGPDGSPDAQSGAGPEPVAGGLVFAGVSAGLDHVCGVTTAGAAYCWGSGTYGELGGGAGVSWAPTPTPVAGGLVFAQVSAGGSQTCGVTTAGAAYCWGQSSLGELGIGSSSGPELCYGSDTIACSTIPAAVSGGLSFATVRASGFSTCGATTTGSVYCWGEDKGVFSSSSAGVTQCAVPPSWEWTDSPVTVTCGLVPAALGGPRVTSLSVSGADYNVCGLDPSGAAYCWGTPGGAVPGGLTFATLSVGFFSSCGVTTAGVAYCWGRNENGELGDGTTTYSYVPVKVAGQP